MSRTSFKFLWGILLLIYIPLMLPVKCGAQLILGQYEDEAPFRTWNTFGVWTGFSLSTGGAHYAQALDSSTALTNPSQLSRLPKFTGVLNGSLNQATFFKYSLVNTGPIFTDENLSLLIYSLDYGGVSVNLNGWGLALSTSILENYDRPTVFSQYRQGGSTLYKLEFEQTGFLRNINFAVSKNLGKQVLLGLGFNFVTGSITKRLEEEYYSGAIIITDHKSHKLKGFYLNGGITLHLSDNFQAAAVFRTPYKKTSDSDSVLGYEAPSAGTDIEVKSQEASTFSQPLLLGGGIHYRFSDRFRAAADATFFNWAKYKAVFFGEERPREFKNIVTLGAGIEYMSRVEIFGIRFDIPWWLGVHYDPQPMKNPNSFYLYGTFGTGLVLERFFLHAGASFGYERGSGDRLRGRKVVLTLGYRLKE